MPAARSIRGLLVLVALGGVLGLLLIPFPATWAGGWRSRLLDLGHVPLFAGLTIGLWACGVGLGRSAVVALARAGGAELVQEGFGRSGNLKDFLVGALGVAAAVAGIRAWQDHRPLPVAGYLALIAGLVTWPLLDTGPTLLDAYFGFRAFPVLADFGSPYELLRWECQQATLVREPGTTAGRLTFLPGSASYPGAGLQPTLNDFQGYRWLCCEFASEDGPLDLVLSVRGGPDETVHYQEGRTYPAGPNRIRLELPAIAAKAQPRPLDLSDIRLVQLFVVQPTEARTIVVRRIYLEE